MEYFQELRKLVGHRPLIMVGATVLLLNSKNEILLMHRTDNGHWGPPGGSLNPGESLEECAIRETFEETGIVLKNPKLFGHYSGPDMYYIYPNGDEVHIVTVVYQEQIESKQISLSHEHDDFNFYSFDRIPNDMSYHIRKIIDDLFTKKMDPKND